MDNFIDFLNPVDESVSAYVASLPKDSIGKNLTFYRRDKAIDFTAHAIALVGVPEDRTAQSDKHTGNNFNAVRKSFYKLHRGNWNTSLYDLGDLKIGNSKQDTLIALQELVVLLLKQKVTPVILGGTHALTYSLYRAYDHLEQRVNLGIVDAQFNLGAIDSEIDPHSFLTGIIMHEPHNLFNLSHIGYQTFLNAQEEISLFKSLLFDAYRLGEVKKNIEIVEPALRETDVLSIDLGAIRKQDAPGNSHTQISGFTADEICRITRYAGLSDKLNVLGIFEYKSDLDTHNFTAELIGQMLWYFVEGFNYRFYEFPNADLKGFKKYIVVIDDKTIHFYKSDKSGRWWMEINITRDNKTLRRTLLPCTYQDYLDASNQEFPDRWLTNKKKFMN